MKARSGKWSVVPLAVVLVFAVACSKSSSGGGNGGGGGGSSSDAGGGLVTSPPPTETSASTPPANGGGDLSGTWTGTWKNITPDNSEGTFTLQWTQQGPALSGTITIDGTPCLTDGQVSGALQGDTIAFGAVSGQVEVAYQGTLVSGTTMQGTYSTACGNATGTWEATKS